MFVFILFSAILEIYFLISLITADFAENTSLIVSKSGFLSRVKPNHQLATGFVQSEFIALVFAPLAIEKNQPLHIISASLNMAFPDASKPVIFSLFGSNSAPRLMADMLVAISTTFADLVASA